MEELGKKRKSYKWINKHYAELGMEESKSVIRSISELMEDQMFEQVRMHLKNRGIEADEEHLGEIVSDIIHLLKFQEIRELF